MLFPPFISLTLLLITLQICAEPVFSESKQSAGRSLKIPETFNQILIESGQDDQVAQISRIESFITSHPEFSRAANWLFEKYESANDLDRAIRFYSSLPDTGLPLITKKWMLAKVYSAQGRTVEALEAFEVALRSGPPTAELIQDFFIFDTRNFRKFEDKVYLAEYGFEAATVGLMTGLWSYLNLNWQEAADHFLSLSPKTQNDLTVLYNWGYCLNRLDEDKLSIDRWQTGLKLARELKDKRFEARFLNNLGHLAESFESTLSYYDSAYVIAKQIGDLKRLERLAGNLAITYSNQGKFSLAETLFLDAIDAARRLQLDSNLSSWYRRYGTHLILQDRFDEALKSYDTSAELAKTTEYSDGLIQCQIRQGELYRMLGQFELAHHTLQKAYDFALEKKWPLLQRQAHIQLALLDFATRKFSQARQVYSLYLKNLPETNDDFLDHSWWYWEMGRTYLAQDHYDEALVEFETAFSMADSATSQLQMANALLYMAEIYTIKNNFKLAHTYLDECAELTQETEIEQVLPALYSLRADAFKKDGALKRAAPYYSKAANLIEQTRRNLTSEEAKLDYFGDKSDIYDKLVDCYRQIHAATGQAAYLDSVYAYMELKRSRTLRELRAANGTQADDPEFAFKRQKLAEVQTRLGSQQRYLRDRRVLLSQAELDSLTTQISASRLSLISQKLRLSQSNTFDSEELLASMPSLPEVRAVLARNEAAAIFYHLTENPFALTIAGDTTVVISLSARDLEPAVQSLLNPFHEANAIDNAVFRADLAHELYTSLIAPIENAVALPATLLIAPDSYLANLPFEILLTNDPDRKSFGLTDTPTYAGDFLVQEYAIGYIPSAAFLTEADLGASSQSVAVFADPFDEAPRTNGQPVASSSLVIPMDPLIYSAKEAREIKKAHANTTIFEQEQATKESLNQASSRYDIFHFATHAFADMTHDAFSGLMLSTDEDDDGDGILMGYEIADLELRADLVALSACETGRGKILRGEGVLGLPRLFLGAGANTVLMTHWKVEDRFAAGLMVDFYRAYLQEGLPKARALAAAKRKVLNSSFQPGGKNYQHPFFWASYGLYGEPGFQSDRSFAGLIVTCAAVLGLLLLGWRFSRRVRAVQVQTG